MPIVTTCAHCNAVISRPPSVIKRCKHHFCNVACKIAYQAEHAARSENSPHWNQVTIPCAACGAQVQRRPSQLKTRKRAFCNRKCKGVYFSVHHTGEHNPNWTKRESTIHCAHCNAVLQRPPSQFTNYAHQFCNKACHGAYLAKHATGKNNHLWRGGGIEYYGPNWRGQQQAARKRDKYTCQHCGKKQKNRALDVHHIQPFRSFGYIPSENENHLLANDLTNLLTLCKKCHKQAEHGNIPIQPYLL